MRSSGILVLLAALLGAAAAANIFESATADPDFATLVDFVAAGDLTAMFQGAGPFTVFVAKNDGFAKIPADVRAGLLKDKAAVKATILRHALSGTFPVRRST